MLADMAMNLEMSRLMTYKSAQEVDMGRPGAYWASIAKWYFFSPKSSNFNLSFFSFAADTANQAAANAVQVLVYSILDFIFHNQ